MSNATRNKLSENCPKTNVEVQSQIWERRNGGGTEGNKRSRTWKQTGPRRKN